MSMTHEQYRKRCPEKFWTGQGRKYGKDTQKNTDNDAMEILNESDSKRTMQKVSDIDEHSGD